MSDYLLLLIILVPFLGAFFVLTSKKDNYYNVDNVYNVSIWSLLLNIGLIILVFSKLDVSTQDIQIFEKYNWLVYPKVNITLGADVFSMLLILSVNLSFIIAKLCADRGFESSKSLLAVELIFISLLNGYLLSCDIISFYVFFMAITAPLIILVSIDGSLKKRNALIRFSLYNLIGALLLLICVMILSSQQSMNIELDKIGGIILKGNIAYFVWFSIFISFISRIPVWPFHYWLSSIISQTKNPLVFVVVNLIPLIGIYGFVRFWPNTMPDIIIKHTLIFDIICIITMLFISIVSLTQKSFRYKIFAYTTVCYLLYLLGVMLPGVVLKQNIGNSLFSFIIIITVLSFLINHIETQKKNLNISGGNGILCYMPRSSMIFSLFILASIGLPITPLFWNNFIIISEIFNYNLILGILVVLSKLIVAIALLDDLYKLKDKSKITGVCVKGVDLSNKSYICFIFCLIILFLSFLKPLWFLI